MTIKQSSTPCLRSSSSQAEGGLMVAYKAMNDQSLGLRSNGNYQGTCLLTLKSNQYPTLWSLSIDYQFIVALAIRVPYTPTRSSALQILRVSPGQRFCGSVLGCLQQSFLEEACDSCQGLRRLLGPGTGDLGRRSTSGKTQIIFWPRLQHSEWSTQPLLQQRPHPLGYVRPSYS
ncbi:hypothetical protein VTK73DRAFT_340 [Phialemonium thermophilum]|uniref:Uncharacterized protein n=1 Tax=Phialemonium thermophilum TaxID=223376 RepID=A0ABR3XFL0_9PEZI